MSDTKVKGWKVFDENLQCRNYQFEVGKTCKHSGEPVMCANGFHFHENAKDLFQFYDFKDTNRVCEIEAENVITGDDKSACTIITVLKELSWLEVLSLVNTGKNNTGRLNSGDMNTGDWNTGDRNSGDRNTGNRNTGNRNTGDWNTGDMNSGNRNSGDRNTGNRNSGNRNTGNWNTGNRNTGNRNTGNWNTGDMNSGDWNTCNFSAGIFNTKEQPTPIFNGAAIVMMSEFRDSEYYRALCYASFMLTEWIDSSDMSDQEKEQHPEYDTTGGYLKKHTFHEACKTWWNDTPQRQRELIQSIPGFSKEIFKEVTGITI